MPELSISIVSHGQANLVHDLLTDIDHYCSGLSLEVLLTLNVEEALPFIVQDYKFPVKVIQNSNPKGFGDNHNAAFKLANGDVFCVLNPDIRLQDNPFPLLLEHITDADVGIVAPSIIIKDHELEDSARHFPTPLKILLKAFSACKGGDYVIADELVFPDWVGGMFMLFRRKTYADIRGFDQRYFLYYEDVDLCARLTLAGFKIVLCPAAQVIHHAHRSSHRNLKYFKWHLSSMLRFFCSPVYWRMQCKKLF